MAAEKNFENKVKKYLTDSGAWYIKYWAGSPYTKEGIPDVLACIDGNFYGIEIKAKNGKPLLLQLVTLRKIRESGGVGLLLYPEEFEGFKRWLDHRCDDWYEHNIKLQDEWFHKLYH